MVDRIKSGTISRALVRLFEQNQSSFSDVLPCLPRIHRGRLHSDACYISLTACRLSTILAATSRCLICSRFMANTQRPQGLAASNGSDLLSPALQFGAFTGKYSISLATPIAILPSNPSIFYTFSFCLYESFSPRRSIQIKSLCTGENGSRSPGSIPQANPYDHFNEAQTPSFQYD